MPEVRMKDAVSGVRDDNMEVFHTSDVNCCMVISVLGKNESGQDGFYFAHLNSFQYEQLGDETAAVKELRQFAQEFSENLKVQAVTNFQPLPEKYNEAPYSAAVKLSGLLRKTFVEPSFQIDGAAARIPYNLSPLKFANVHNGGANITLSTEGEMFVATPQTVTSFNNIRNLENYKTYSLGENNAYLREQARTNPPQSKMFRRCLIM